MLEKSFWAPHVLFTCFSPVGLWSFNDELIGLNISFIFSNDEPPSGLNISFIFSKKGRGNSTMSIYLQSTTFHLFSPKGVKSFNYEHKPIGLNITFLILLVFIPQTAYIRCSNETMLYNLCILSCCGVDFFCKHLTILNTLSWV